MQILKLEWRNIFSYGNNIETIDFGDEHKLWLLTGVSGAGKTSFLTIPKLLLFGKTEGSDGKAFKVGAIANRINKHGWIRGTIKNGNDMFIIERTFSPQGLTVWKNGENLDQAGIKNVQAVIDREILDDMPYNIFANVMTLSLNNFKSFISMTPADKRAIIDKVFALDLINKISELVKKDKRDLGNAINETRTAIFQIDRNIEYSRTQLENMGVSVDKGALETKLAEIDAKLSKLAELHTQQTELYKTYYTKVSEYANAENEIRRVMSAENVEASHIREKIRLFNEDKCPTCGSPFNGTEFDELRQKLAAALSEKESNIMEYNNNLTKIATEKSSIMNDLSEIQNNINSIAAKANELTIEKRSIEADLNKPDQYDVVKGIIDKNTEEREKFEKALADNETKMRYMTALDGLYSSDGIKQQIMNNYIPTLNAEILETLSIIGFPYTLTFDGNFDPHLQHLGEDIDPQTLSCGEHKKVDLVVLCSILRMLKTKYPQINLVCLDETISSLDPDSSSDILRYLKKIAADMGLNIFVVSHTNLTQELFDVHIHIEKPAGFSEIKYL